MSARCSAACQSTPYPPIETFPEEFDDSWYIGSIPDQPFDVPLVDRTRMRPELMRQTVPYTENEKPGTIIVNIDERFLYLVQADHTALRYGIGVGRQGFSWRGTAEVGRKGLDLVAQRLAVRMVLEGQLGQQALQVLINLEHRGACGCT